jgi:hypothetical protein
LALSSLAGLLGFIPVLIDDEGSWLGLLLGHLLLLHRGGIFWREGDVS